jgi:hypothetical protein
MPVFPSGNNHRSIFSEVGNQELLHLSEKYIEASNPFCADFSFTLWVGKNHEEDLCVAHQF